MIFFKPSLILAGFLIILGIKTSFAQLPDTAPPHVFEEWAKQHVKEKVYVHTDRAVYFKGDSIWFKAYVVTGSGNQLSRLSGALYVELIGKAGKVSQIKVPVVNGLAKGCFSTDFMLDEGNYSIRAYTRLMRNDQTSFFQKNIYLGNSKAANIFSSVVTSTGTENGMNKVVINYTNEKGERISDQSLKYCVLEGQDTLKSGKAFTDKDGNLLLSFKANNRLKLANVKVEAEKEGKVVNTIVAINQPSDIDLQFFAEGGTLVNGLQSRIAVKSVGPDGYGKDIEGRIVDNNGETVTSFKTNHYGMGEFFLAPEPGKTYTAITELKGAVPPKLILPLASAEGVTFSAYTNNPDTIVIRFQASPAVYNTKSVWHLAGIAGNELVILNDFTLNRPITSLKLPCKELPAGVIQLTLFSDKYEPVAERLVFNYPQVKSSLTISELKTTYKTREKVAVNLHGVIEGKPTVGSYSISVVDENFIGDTEDDEQTILSTLLLSSDIKGHIEHPNYYFHNIDDKKRAELDLLLRTQGYRSFNWKALKEDKKPLFAPETVGTVFSGYAKTLGGKPYPGADVTILSLKAKLFQQTKADELGRFVFPPFVLADSVKLTFKASAPDKKRRLAIEVDSIPGFHPVNKDSYEYLYRNSFRQDKLDKVLDFKGEQQTKFGLGLGIDLKEVTVKGTKGRNTSSDDFDLARGADQVLVGDQFKSCATLSICLAGMLNGVIFKTVTTDFGVVNAPFLTRGGSNASPMRLYWNGLPIDLHDYPNYLEQNVENPQDIVSIKILKNDHYANIYGAQGRGVILVSTRGNRLSGNKLNLSTLLFQPTGFNKVREFYVPKYDVPSKVKRPDYRTTVYWNPSLVSSSEGNVPITYFNSDALGRFRITVEGITPDGIMQRAIYRYKVE